MDEPKLKIVKNAKKDQFIETIVVIIIYIILLSIPFLAVKYVRQTEELNHGNIRRQLNHDVTTFIPQPGPFISSWTEYDRFINGSTYRNTIYDDIFISEIFVMLFSWNGTFNLLLSLMGIFARAHLSYLNYFAICVSKKRLMAFLCFASLFAVIVVFAVDGTFCVLISWTGTKLRQWTDENIIEATSQLKGVDVIYRRLPHPFTMGLDSPYFLHIHYRYPKEDIVFVCEYEVLSLEDAFAVFDTVWWRKDGVPIEINDRVYINVSIRPYQQEPNIISPLQMFILRSTLTIEVIDNNDFGWYTCDYANPMRVKVKPFFEKSSGTFQSPESSQPMSPHPNCNCQPSFPSEDKSVSETEAKTLTSSYIRRICFAEFELRKQPPSEQILPVKVSPGAILIDVATYKTVAPSDDIQIDITSNSTLHSEMSSECCSAVIKLYWIFFKQGGFVTFPFSRQARNDLEGIILAKWMCICESANGILSNSFIRKYYNKTDRKYDEIDIEYPVKLDLHLQHNHVMLSESIPFLKDYLDHFLKSSSFTIYIHDAAFILMFVISEILIVIFVIWSKNHILKPLRRCCFHMLEVPRWQFEAVEGTILRNVRVNRRDQQRYDVFLSYNEEEDYDKQVSNFLKRKLRDLNLRVFDVTCIRPGHPTFEETAEAIRHSSRFVIVASQAYLEDGEKQLEFDAIGDTIISQRSRPKNRLLVIRLDDCNINGFHRVPCIHVPNAVREQSSLDQACENTFLTWASLAKKHTNMNIVCQLTQYGFSWKSVAIICVLLLVIIYGNFYVDDIIPLCLKSNDLENSCEDTFDI